MLCVSEIGTLSQTENKAWSTPYKQLYKRKTVRGTYMVTGASLRQIDVTIYTYSFGPNRPYMSTWTIENELF